MRIFAGVPREGRQSSNDSNGDALRPSILTSALTDYGQYVSAGHASCDGGGGVPE